MKVKPAHKRRSWAQIVNGHPPSATWPRPAPSQIPPKRQSEFNRLCAAVRAFELGQISEIKSKHQVTNDRARRTYEACVTINRNTGQVYGFFRCIPGRRFHTKRQERIKPFDPKHTEKGRGWKLAFRELCKKYPKVLARLTTFALTRKLNLTDDEDADVEPYARAGPPEAHAAFLSLCAWAGVPETEWPFAADRLGESAIYDWYRGLRAAYPVETTQNEHGDDAAAKAKVDRKAAGGNVIKPPEKRAYQEVQLDEHHIDGIYSVMYPGPHGLWLVVDYVRIWFLALVESRNGAILSTVTTFGSSFNTDDLFKLFRRALWPLPQFELTFTTPAHRYRKGAAYPGELAELRGLTFQVVKFDRHSTHTTAMQRGALEQVFGTEFKPGVVGHPMQQNMVENTFGILEGMLTGLPNTTGKHPTDPVRRDAEGAARRLKMPPLLAAEIFDVAARNLNARVHTGNLSRLDELLQWKLNRDMYESRLEDFGPHNGHLLLPAIPVYASRTNGATGSFGVNYEYGRFSSKELRSCAELEASNDWSGFLYPQEDGRSAFFTANAVKDRVFDLDILGAWADVPHSTAWRAAIGGMRNRASRPESVSDTRATLELTSALGMKAVNGDAAATQLLSQITNQMAEISLGRYQRVPSSSSGVQPSAPAEREEHNELPDAPASTRVPAPEVDVIDEAEALKQILEEGAQGRDPALHTKQAEEAHKAPVTREVKGVAAANEPLDSADSGETAGSDQTGPNHRTRSRPSLTSTDDPWNFDI